MLFCLFEESFVSRYLILTAIFIDFFLAHYLVTYAENPLGLWYVINMDHVLFKIDINNT